VTGLSRLVVAALAGIIPLAACSGAGGSAGDDASGAVPRQIGAADDAAAATDSPGVLPAELAAGRRLFEANCQRCHGPQASGTEQGPPLVHIVYEPNHHSDAAFQRAAALGVPAHHWTFGDMPPVPGVTPEQVAEITAYVRWLQRQAGIG
jgi:mono/diheme cytochrome c family protein